MTIDDYRSLYLPNSPGVYRFIDEAGEILYIGRATALRDRVRSYFSKELIEQRGIAFIDMVTRATHIEYTETSSVLEAIMLEARLIKKFQPYYNSKEKDNKSYYYVVITDEKFPRVFLERERVLVQAGVPLSGVSNASESAWIKLPGSREYQLPYSVGQVIGPFPSGSIIRESLRLLRKIFPFRSGKTVNKNRDRFYESMGLAMPLLNDTDVDAIQKVSDSMSQAYRVMINDLCAVLSGKQEELLLELEKRMLDYAKQEKFEEASRVRDLIWSLKHIRDVSLISAERYYVGSVRIEAYDIAHMSGNAMVGVMVVLENGEPQKSEYRKFHLRGINSANDPLALSQILVRRFRHRNWQMPNIIVMDGGQVQKSVGDRVVANHKLNISVVSVVKDERHRARDILGDKAIIEKWRDAILLANAEAHRFAITFHKKVRNKKFLS